MDDRLELFDTVDRRPDLPLPSRSRWQPLRLGLVELFLYDSEEFWFRDGHLLLRGNNGTGKSKVLSLTLPFLLDAQLRASRIEPDGDPGKKMAWNLLMNGYDRRNGYSWIEFGRLAEDGTPRYLTLGAGLAAVAARAEVDGWFFILEDGPGQARIGQDLWLINENRIVPTRERLRDLLDGRGQVFETAAAYRRAVDERLFRLGTKRYEALMDTLIQLRQPQLSRKPDETALSDALTEALPPLPIELLGDVAEAMNQLDEDRRRLEEFQQLGQAVERFDRRYRIYAGALSRRQARELRQSQTEFDNASRDCNEALARLDQAREAEAAAEAAQGQTTLALARSRATLDTLLSDPAMQDANRLATAEADARTRREAIQRMLAARGEAADRLAREEAATHQSVERATRAEQGVVAARAECHEQARLAGVAAGYGGQPLAMLDLNRLAAMAVHDLDRGQSGLRELVSVRREQVALLRHLRSGVDQAEALAAQRAETVRERHDDRASAAARREAADALVETEGGRLVDQWTDHLMGLRQLRCDAAAPLAALADWVVQLQGDNPARQALLAAQQEGSARLAAEKADLDGQIQALAREQAELVAERDGLAAGRDSGPRAPHTRGPATRQDRPGAPLWQLVDFRDHLDDACRAGLEAALEASGLLDAWVTPEGTLISAGDGALWLDSQVVDRQAVPSAASLGTGLRATVPADSPVSVATVDRLLAGIACAAVDPPAAEAWVSLDGRFRLGALAGAWTKPQAAYIGFAARAAARARRLADIAARLGELAEQLEQLGRQREAHAQACRQAELEWRQAPADDSLRQAHAGASAAAREFRDAAERLVRAEAARHEAEQAARDAALSLAADAADLGLPVELEALLAVEAALNLFNDAQHQLLRAVQEWRRAWPELESQRQRAQEARQALLGRDEDLAQGRIEAEEAEARYEVLRQAVGLQVDALRRQLSEARDEVAAAETALTRAEKTWRAAGEGRAVAATTREVAQQSLVQRTEIRARAVVRLQRFAETTLLSSALPDLDLPEPGAPWSMDPALTLARRVEQALADIKDDDETYARLQRQTGEDLQELQRALSALGHQAPAEPSDWGLVVHIIYQNRPERPDRLAARMADEIAQRSELLSARERQVLENHLQAEIAAEVQRLLQAAEKQVVDINAELHKRPTSTGVRYRLQWLPLTEGEGAPVGLEAARQKLLHTSADLWSAEDRRVVGGMLQSRITAERERADSEAGRDGGALIDLLARALDYRRWHRFRVQRFQDGQWRKLSGPASSGERALGLTVPLFAAIASFYSQGGDSRAPRLMLLDEAFAGIDDTARAHCMGLIREFDLDFVITSEREWGCYAELPGVAICQLQRREGIDAVYVSRWTWDGRAKRRDDDPDRRFAR